MHLTVPITLFQKISLFIMLCLTLSDVLAIEVEQFVEVSIIVLKITAFENLRTITQAKNMETRHTTPFLSNFSALSVCDINFCT